MNKATWSVNRICVDYTVFLGMARKCVQSVLMTNAVKAEMKGLIVCELSNMRLKRDTLFGATQAPIKETPVQPVTRWKH